MSLTFEYCRMLSRMRVYYGSVEILFLTGISKDQADIVYASLQTLLTEVKKEIGQAREVD